MSLRRPILAFLVGLIGYFLLAQLGLAINNIHLHVAAIWPASGFAFLWYTFMGMPALLGIAAGSFLINYTVGNSIPLSLGIVAGTFIEIYLAHYIYQRFVNKAKQTGLHQRITKVFSAFFAPSLVAASFGVLTLYFMGNISHEDMPFSFLTWAIGDGLALLFFVPFFYAGKIWYSESQTRLKDLLVFLGLSLLSGVYAYFLSIYSISDYFVFFFLFLILTTARVLGTTHAYFLALGFYVVRVYLARHSIGFPLGTTLQFSLIHLQIVMASIAFTLIVADDFSRYKLSKRPLWVMGITWIISSFAYTIVLLGQINSVNDEYQEQIAQENAKLQSRVEVYSSAIRTIAAHVGSKKNRCNPDWVPFVTETGLLNDYPGLNGVGIIFAIPRRDLQTWYHDFSKKCKTEFDIRPMPKADNLDYPEAFVCVSTAPLDIHEIIKGYDISTEKKRFNAAIAARNTGQIGITEPIILANAGHKKWSFLFLAPINGVDGFLGWIHAPVVWDNFMAHAFGEHPRGFDYRITYKGEVLYQTFKTPPHNPFTSNFTFQIGDKSFQLEWMINTYLTNNHDWVSVWVAFLLTGVSLLLAIVVGNLELLTIQANEIAEHKSAALVSAAKMASVGELSSNIAHEINNPLGIILGSLEVIKLKKMDNELTPEYLDEIHERIRKTTMRMGKIVHGMQTLSKDASRVPRRTISLTSPIEICLELVREKFKEHSIELRLNLDPEAIIVGNETEITQIVTNLLNNAFDAVRETKDAWIEVQTRKSLSSVDLIITDSGPGLPEEIADKIMTPWFTTKDYNQGSGLGLSISLRIMQAHNGSLELDRHSTNTRFVATFPIA